MNWGWNLLKLTPDDSYEDNDKNNMESFEFSKSFSNLENSNVSNSCSGSISRSNSTTTLKYKKPENLDISRISDKILVTSRFWQSDREVSPQPQYQSTIINAIDDMATFLNNKYKDRYMIWNIGTPDGLYSPSYFNFRVIHSALPRSQVFTVKHLFHLCHSIIGWLQLNASEQGCHDGVVIIQCNDGWKRCSLLVSCLLKFAGAVSSTFEGFDLFSSRRQRQQPPTIHHDDPTIVSTTRYLKYFNDVLMHAGKLINPDPLNLHQIIISSIPNFDGSGGCSAGVEIFQNNNLIFSTSESDCSLKNKTAVSDDDKIFYFKDNFHIIFRFDENELDRDILIHVFHTHPQTRQRSTIFSFPFNTGFVHPGVIRLKATDLEIPAWNTPPPTTIFNMKSSDQNRFSSDFTVDLILLPVNNGDNSGQIDVSTVDYSSSIKNNFAKNLIRLSQMHPVRPDVHVAKPLELQGFKKFYVKLALQLHGNDIHRAHEYLTTLHETKGVLFEAFDSSFRDLTHRSHNKKEISDQKEDNCFIATNEIASNTTENHIHKNRAMESMIASNNKFNKCEDVKDEVIVETDETNSGREEENDLETQQVKDDVIKTFNPIPAPFIPPPPPPLPNLFNNKSIPPPPPPPLPTCMPGLGRVIEDDISRPRVKNALHWQELQIDPGTTSVPKKLTVWHEFAFGSFDTEIEIDVKQFEETFCISRKASITSGNRCSSDNFSHTVTIDTQSQQQLLPKVIDIRRANNVAIGLARFTKRFPDLDTLIESVLNGGDDHKGQQQQQQHLTVDDYLTIQTILPTAEEVQKFRILHQQQSNKKKNMCGDGQLNESETFLHLIVNKYLNIIPFLVKFRIFSSNALTDLTGILQKFEAITEGLKGLKRSVEFKIVLKSILDLGNLANYEYSASSTSKYSLASTTATTNLTAAGFTLNSLCKLHEMKSVDGRSNLLIFLTNSLLSTHPEIISLIDTDSLRNLEILKGWHGRTLQAEMLKISHLTNELEQEFLDGFSKSESRDQDQDRDKDNNEDKINFLKVKAEVEAFLSKFKEFYRSKAEMIVQEFNETWTNTREYYYGTTFEEFCSDTEDVSSFFANIWQFLKNLENAVKVSMKSKSTTTAQDQEVKSKLINRSISNVSSISCSKSDSFCEES